MADKSKSADDKVRAARERFEECQSAESENRKTALEDMKFAREGVQWPDDIRNQREREGRPCLTINKMPAFIRQVVNDARQNKPSIKVHPADSGADPETAEVINGLIKNIEYTSNADVAYDTATECAVTGGFGYIRVGLDYAYDDAFDLDIRIERVSNPFSVYGDPHSTAADSSDWDVAFVTDRLSKKQFETEYKGAAKVDFDDDAWSGLRGTEWVSEDDVMVAEYWTREKVDRQISLFVDTRDGSVVTLGNDDIEKDEDLQFLIQNQIIQFRQERTTKTCKVKQCIMSGLEVLKETDWLGKYIPIIPVYGDEFDIEGKRYFRSLIHNAIDAQRMFNYWRTNSTELVALAPRVPYIGPKGAFATDPGWQTANKASHPYLEYDTDAVRQAGGTPPARQAIDTGTAAGALQEALNANDDMKAIIGLYDASLGARSNETSGRAIMARQREGDVATFHFIDNMSRAIRHTGRIILDLIPKVYNTPRMIRVLGEDGSQAAKQVNQQTQMTDKKGKPVLGPDGKPVIGIHDLTSGKYDLTVTTGPSFTTRREEAAMQMTEMIRAFPAAAPVVGPHLAKNLDWPGADEIAEELDAIKSGQIPEQAQKQMQEMAQKVQQLEEENKNLKLSQEADIAKVEAQKQIESVKIESNHAIKVMELESEEQIAYAKIAAEERVNAKKAEFAAANAAEANRMKAQQRPSAQ